MATFAASASAQQSGDGLTATFIDASSYGSNTQGYVIANFTTRQFILTDAFNNPVAILNLGTALSVNYPLVKDMFIQAKLNLIGPVDGPFTQNIKVAFQRINQDMYRNIAKQGCCQNKEIDEALNFADRAFRDANIAALAGDGAGFQNDMDDINTVLTPYQ